MTAFDGYALIYQESEQLRNRLSMKVKILNNIIVCLCIMRVFISYLKFLQCYCTHTRANVYFLFVLIIKFELVFADR